MRHVASPRCSNQKIHKIYTVNYKFHIKPWQPWFQDEDQSPWCQLQELQAPAHRKWYHFCIKNHLSWNTEWMEIRRVFRNVIEQIEKNWSSTNNSNSLHVSMWCSCLLRISSCISRISFRSSVTSILASCKASNSDPRKQKEINWNSEIRVWQIYVHHLDCWLMLLALLKSYIAAIMDKVQIVPVFYSQHNVVNSHLTDSEVAVTVLVSFNTIVCYSSVRAMQTWPVWDYWRTNLEPTFISKQFDHLRSNHVQSYCHMDLLMNIHCGVRVVVGLKFAPRCGILRIGKPNLSNKIRIEPHEMSIED